MGSRCHIDVIPSLPQIILTLLLSILAASTANVIANTALNTCTILGNIHMCVCVHVSTCGVGMCVYVCMHVCMRVCVCVCVCVCEVVLTSSHSPVSPLCGGVLPIGCS